MSADWVIVKDPMAGDYETPHMTPRSFDSVRDSVEWSLDIVQLMRRLHELYVLQNSPAMEADWLWNRVVRAFWGDCLTLETLGVLKF